MTHAYLGSSFAHGEVEALLETETEEIAGQRLHVQPSTDARRLCRARGKPRSRRDGSWAGSRGAWSGARARSATARSSATRGGADMKDILNLKIKRRESFRPFAPSILRGARRRVVRGRRRRPVHDAGVSRSAQEKRAADSGRDPRRRHGPAADRLPRDQSALLRADRGVPRADRRADGAQHLVQRKRAGRLHARTRRSTASCARRWTCWCSTGT